ncbi:MAG: hypothetical protein WCE75_08280 [Terracidiphilus sp.]
MNVHGVVTACVCFARTGRVSDVGIVSGPPMMQQSVLDSLKDWTFLPVLQAGKRRAGCGPLRIRVDVTSGVASSRLEP